MAPPIDPNYREAFKQAIPELIKTLPDRDAEVRQETIYALYTAEEMTLPVFRQALGDRDDEMRRTLIRSLGYLRFPAIPVLLQALQDRTARVRLNAAYIFAEFNLYNYLQKNDPLFEAISHAEPILLQILREGDAGVRKATGIALSRAGEQVNAPLLEMLEAESIPLRQSAAIILGGRRAVIPALLRLLQSEKPATRWSAVAALYEHGYVPRLALRPRLQVTLRHTLRSRGSKLGRFLIGLQMRASFLHRIPIRSPDAEPYQSPAVTLSEIRK